MIMGDNLKEWVESVESDGTLNLELLNECCDVKLYRVYPEDFRDREYYVWSGDKCLYHVKDLSVSEYYFTCMHMDIKDFQKNPSKVQEAIDKLEELKNIGSVDEIDKYKESIDMAVESLKKHHLTTNRDAFFKRLYMYYEDFSDNKLAEMIDYNPEDCDFKCPLNGTTHCPFYGLPLDVNEPEISCSDAIGKWLSEPYDADAEKNIRYVRA